MGCIQRWILSSHIIATWNSDFKQRIGVDKQKTQPKDVLKLRKDFDEAAVHSCIDTINQWSNPFQNHGSLIVLSSGIVADDGIVQDLHRAEAVGKSNLERFVREWIIDGTVPFTSLSRKIIYWHWVLQLRK